MSDPNPYSPPKTDPTLPVPPRPGGTPPEPDASPEEKDRWWFQNVYQGDNMPQAT